MHDLAMSQIRRSTVWGGVALGSVLSIVALACDRGREVPDVPSDEIVAIADQAGAVCGMYVAEQPAPRAQVVHRDGTRLFLCSIGDLLVHLSVPSPHGAARRIFVEVLEPTEDPEAPATGAHRWQDATTVRYVIGVPRPGVMGLPVLTYADRASAEDIAKRYPGAEVLDWPGLERRWQEREGR